MQKEMGLEEKRGSYLTQMIFTASLQNSIPTQICQLFLNISKGKG